jgi:hypothetical protein
MELPTSDDGMLGEEGVMEAASEAYGASDPIKAFREAALTRSDHDSFQDDTLAVWLQRNADEA